MEHQFETSGLVWKPMRTETQEINSSLGGQAQEKHAGGLSSNGAKRQEDLAILLTCVWKSLR